MAIGTTQTATVSNGLPTMVAKARQIREQDGVMPQLVDKATLAEGTGTAWREVAFSRLADASTISEGDEFDSFQQLATTLITGTPVEIGGATLITDRVRRRLDRKAYAQIGGLLGNMMQRKKAKDGITQLDSFSTSFGGAGTTFASGYIHAAVDQIEGNATERGVRPIRTVLHGFQRRDLSNELAPVGTYPIPDGVSQTIVSQNFAGSIGGSEVYFDSVKAPDSANDFKGGTFSREAIVLVQGYDLYAEEDRQVGRRANAAYMFDEYVYVERADTMGIEQYFDATAPTS